MFNQEFVKQILEYAGTVIAIVQAVKMFLRQVGLKWVKDWVSLVLTALVSYLVTLQLYSSMDLAKYIVFVVFVFLQASGLYMVGSQWAKKAGASVQFKTKK